MRLLRASILIAIVVLPVVGIGWHYSNEILGPDEPTAKSGQTVIAHSDSTITLRATAKAKRPGIWAIEWPDGYGQIGPLVSVDQDRVDTRFQILHGSRPDTSVRLGGFARDANPRTWLGLDYQDAVVPSRIGPLPAWLVPGRDSTWAVFVHGRGATRAEVLRMLPAYRALDLPCLILAYRNDPGAPTVAGGYRLGLTEWQDLEDAVRYARAEGARDVVLVGCSMGGGIVAQLLRRSPDAAQVRAAVLDAPALDWNELIAAAGRQRRVPTLVTELGKLVVSLRTGIRWDDLVQVRHANAFAIPILIVHGEADSTAPIAASHRFVAARPDLVQLITVPGAGHVESANVDSEGYAQRVSQWLRALGIGRAGQVAPTIRRTRPSSDTM